jgi:hypothetical protein
VIVNSTRNVGTSGEQAARSYRSRHPEATNPLIFAETIALVRSIMNI